PDMKATKRSARETRARIRRQAIAGSEAIRVVPTHPSKPTVRLDELAIGGEPAGRDLFDGKPRLAPADVALTYRGWPLLTQVEVLTIFWGAGWSTGPRSRDLMDRIQRFFVDILAGPVIDQLAEYSVPGQEIGHGSLLGAKAIAADAPRGSVTDSAIKARIK